MRKRTLILTGLLAVLFVPVSLLNARAGAGSGADQTTAVAAAVEQSLGNLHLYLPPDRVYDSRPGSGLLGGGAGPIVSTSRRVAIRVPATAVAAEVNLTATNTSANGWMRAYGIGLTPLHSNLNWNAPGQSIANQITVPVTRAGVAQAGCTTSCLFEFEVQTSGSADVVIDTVGYYEAA